MFKYFTYRELYNNILHLNQKFKIYKNKIRIKFLKNMSKDNSYVIINKESEREREREREREGTIQKTINYSILTYHKYFRIFISSQLFIS